MAKEENIGRKKVVKLPQPTQEDKIKSLTKLIEELDNENKALRQRLTEASQHIRQLNQEAFYAHLSWLWTVLSADERIKSSFNPDFIEARRKEFEDMMTPKEAPKEAVKEEK